MLTERDGLISLRNKVSQVGIENDSGWRINGTNTHYLRTLTFRTVVTQDTTILASVWLSEELANPHTGESPEVWNIKKLNDFTLLMCRSNPEYQEQVSE